MILNPPSAEALDNSALRAHFNACEVVFTLLHEFQEVFDEYTGVKETRWSEYVSSSEIELGSALHNLAQANELALKARICRVSPFLLLLGSGVKLPKDSTDVEFADLRTIDAVDLVSTVNAVSSEKVPDAYASSIRKLRIDRNRFAHLGVLNETVDVTYLTSLISDQFTALWPDRNWLPTWIALREKERKAHFSDHKYYTWYTEVMELIPTINSVLSKSQFRKLIGFEKNKLRYFCYDCFSAACLERADVDPQPYKTAYLPNKDILHCGMCGQDWPVYRKKCSATDCKSDVMLSEDNSMGYSPVCCSCGQAAEEQ